MTVTPDLIASLVQKEYDKLPAKRKPINRGNGIQEWVPLSGIVAQGRDDKLHCIALAYVTGMKCLPSSKLPQAQGAVLHDWHAEVLALRAFNAFVLDECRALLSSQDPPDPASPSPSSEFLRRRTRDEISAASSRAGDGVESSTHYYHAQPFAWRDDVRLHMYCSEAPCGDASMELVMAAQADATPWDISTAAPLPPSSSSPSPSSSPTTPTPDPDPSPLPGRAYFSHLGITRRKPSRPDAPPTLSKSCSDKLAQSQALSLLSSPVSLLVSPANLYLTTLVLSASQLDPGACRRAFSPDGGRMAPLRHRIVALDHDDDGQNARGGGGWPGGYAFRPFAVAATDLEFAFSRREVGRRAEKTAPSNLAVAWTRSSGLRNPGREETTLGGTLQGRKQFDIRGASFASRRRMWGLAAEVAGALGVGMVEVQRALHAETYGEMKHSGLLQARREVKEETRREALKSWVRNVGDDDFSL
ncbi:adenosine-deaminase domain-containing protein [Xylariaceae sp. FL0016]|nr:adenosine-deaminase domain-containing protein [Xylariaceae sp. FL0016]